MDPQALLDSWKDYVAPSAPCTAADMDRRIARFGEIPASPRAFVDTYVKGHERVLYSVIGSGVTDDPNFKPKIAAAENFHVDYIIAPPGCGAALHWHDSEEVFVVQSGRWEFDWIDGASGDKHTVSLNPRDTISVPPFVHRAFRSLDGESGMLVSILGGKTPGRVMWHASLADRAKAVGAGFDANGMAHRIGE
ncbi:cupin domain-containing protein [Variovorax terrae]|uniref:Cupin domain-containing protein n=1 Tax=Variovorax terrae TaxID=2923278 RepID=A0A9X1W4M3_9BURK|nr:cupin domain-containing protein [Variovorax terrae]MCJ0765698.1 cupin domain-containing protein [Variovorax terrae]